jgi:hypothetical protein
MMGRGLSILALLLLAVVAFGLYQLSYAVQRREDELVELNRALLQERETIGVLQAEWSYLTRPEYLQDKAQRLLDMRPATAKDIVTLDSLPWRQDRTGTDKAAPPANTAPLASAGTQPAAAPAPVRVAARPADPAVAPAPNAAAPNLDAEAAAVLGAMQRALAGPAGKPGRAQ